MQDEEESNWTVFVPFRRCDEEITCEKSKKKKRFRNLNRKVVNLKSAKQTILQRISSWTIGMSGVICIAKK